MEKPFNTKIFLILQCAAVAGLLAVIPYALALNPAATPDKLPLPLPLIAAIQIGIQALMFAAAIAVGLFFSTRIGLGLPLLEAKLKGEPIAPNVRAILPFSAVAGIVSSVLIVALDVYVFQPALGGAIGVKLPGRANPAAWKGFLASFYGGINEEILLRLCLLSFLAWVGGFLLRGQNGKPAISAFWTANVVAAILFGLGHLPATSMILPVTPLVVLRAVVLNGLAGIAFGYLYFRFGLESAMLAHFIADIVLHVLLAL
ncbi:MAG TPA: CPBP family glutamic-type intramembrane protease [Leptospiraceae bacterium]|nr:CPBP family glutamic-type intramembrane protease [Leptospiraceae bacterium]HNL01696.1 CPBP family glutamic-type intramembrane protease [Leptospiraceae bacterium]